MKKTFFTSPGFLLSLLFIFLQQGFMLADGWKEDLHNRKGFVENKGQFKPLETTNGWEDVLYVYDGPNEQYYFTSKGLTIRLFTREKRQKSESEKQQRLEQKKSGFKSLEEWQRFEKAGNRVTEINDDLTFTWFGVNEQMRVIAGDKNTFYSSYTYMDKAGKSVNINNIPTYRSITYQNIYPNTDITYEFHPETGLKYSIILHPGARPELVKLNYSKRPVVLADGSLSLLTRLGAITEHPPVTFYAGEQDNIIPSSYRANGNSVVYKIGDFNRNKTIIIDPWIQTPSFATNWDCVWECERDAAGNVYILGGVTPLQLLKYNAAGALQWTYNTPYDTSMWLGTFATDLAGNSYISNGSTAQIQKVNTGGGLVWDNPSPGGLFSSTEFWSMAFNCDQTKLVVGGTGGLLFDILPYLYDIDVNSGNVISSQQVHGPGALFSFPPNTNEVRSVTATKNNKYYFLTHDSIGYISTDLGLCPNTQLPFHTANDNYNLSYKCENWRYNNTGLEAMAYYNNFIFVNRGTRLDKIDFNTAQVLQSVTIPGGGFTAALGQNAVQNSGIDIDDCGNIFVGSKNGVYVFDQNLIQTASFPTTFNVYDVAVSINGDIIACGSTGNSGSANRTGSVQSFAASACIPQATVCCDASICTVPFLCTGDAPVQLTPSVSGGTWSGTGVNGSGLFDPGIAGSGVHTITYTMPCGSETVNITVNNCSALSVCVEANGDLTVSGGSGPYNWQQQTTVQDCSACLIGCIIPPGCAVNVTNWTNFTTGVTVTVTVPYPIQVVDNSGTVFPIPGVSSLPACSACPPLISQFDSISDAECSGGTGYAEISTSGGTGPYSYTWNPGNFTGDIQNNLNPGSYTVSIQDQNGCTGTTTITISEPSSLQADTSGVQDASCMQPNGMLFFGASGGTAPYIYTWSQGGNVIQTSAAVSVTDTVFSLVAGTYTVLISDANACTFSDTLIINTTPIPQLTLAALTDASCGVNNGSITLNANGGTGTYQLQWFNNGTLIQTSNNVTTADSLINTGAGTYDVIVTDAGGCSDSITVSVNNSNAATLNILNLLPILCLGSDSGLAVVSATGGSGPYDFSWSFNAAVIQNTNNSPLPDTLITNQPGTYILTVSDSLGCISTTQVNIPGPSAILDISGVIINNATCGNSDGSIQITVTGGTPGTGYQYSWTPSGGNGQVASGLGVGLYTVQVTDSNLCVVDSTISIANINGPVVTISGFTQPTCYGYSNGTITATVTGGTGSLNYLWSPGGDTTLVVNNASSAGYTLTVTDSLGCEGQASVQISQPPLIVGNISVTDATCGQANGSASITASGGTGPFTYEWNNGSASVISTGLSAGNCNVVVTDSTGCMQIFTAVVGTTGLYTIDAGLGASIFAGDEIELQANAPSGAIYLWSPSSSLSCSDCLNPLASPDSTTTYTLLVNLDGCIVSDTVTITVETKCGDIWMPSAFSPNGDKENDVLMVRGNCVSDLDFKIYDRWGELVFESHDQGYGWDGTFKSKPMNQAVFTYYISVNTPDGIKILKGNVTLVRY